MHFQLIAMERFQVRLNLLFAFSILNVYLCLQPLTLGQKGLLVDHLLSSNKILRVL